MAVVVRKNNGDLNFASKIILEHYIFCLKEIENTRDCYELREKYENQSWALSYALVALGVDVEESVKQSR